MGPEGGNAGGQVIAAGPPERVVEVEGSHTAEHLRAKLEKRPHKQLANAV
jgi:excinuclease ABC subunit A